MNEENKNYYWLFLPNNMKFPNMKEAKLVLGKNRFRRLLKNGKVKLVIEGENNKI